MAKPSSKTVRVRGIPSQIDYAEFLGVAQRLASNTIDGRWLPWPSSTRPGDNNPIISFASQWGEHIGTISLPSEEHKELAMTHHGSQWTFDDKFDGITILKSPEDSDLDICAVHGLDGNSFDTWAARNNKMWLRDILPARKPFDRARIMTFGYSSQLSDRANLSGISEWAHQLLVCISSVRQSQGERDRPMIVVCHSMGGLVARQAMIRLNEYSHKSEYRGIKLKLCGLLFLSTPHSGSSDADWNGFLIDIAELAWGTRREIVDSLKTFNPLSAKAQEDFANMKHVPPVYAFYETKKTQIKGLSRHIVTRQSASLNGHIASPLPDVDHNTICKFESKFGGFIYVAEKLEYLKDVLTNEVGNRVLESNKPWSTPAIAPNCPQPPGKMFLEGKGLARRSKFAGRERELKDLQRFLDVEMDDKKIVPITGIGGIGYAKSS